MFSQFDIHINLLSYFTIYHDNNAHMCIHTSSSRHYLLYFLHNITIIDTICVCRIRFFISFLPSPFICIGIILSPSHSSFAPAQWSTNRFISHATGSITQISLSQRKFSLLSYSAAAIVLRILNFFLIQLNIYVFVNSFVILVQTISFANLTIIPVYVPYYTG